MNLSGIIAISGRPGLYKVIAQGKNNVIVESLSDRKRFPAYTSDRISALEDISLYTYEEDKPLREIFKSIYEKENGGESISQKESDLNLISYLIEILPNYDKERVYVSDIKKVFQWYNLLQKAGELKLKEDLVLEKENQIIEEVVAEEKAVKPAKTKKAVVSKEKEGKVKKTTKK